MVDGHFTWGNSIVLSNINSLPSEAAVRTRPADGAGSRRCYLCHDAGQRSGGYASIDIDGHRRWADGDCVLGQHLASGAMPRPAAFRTGGRRLQLYHCKPPPPAPAGLWVENAPQQQAETEGQTTSARLEQGRDRILNFPEAPPVDTRFRVWAI